MYLRSICPKWYLYGFGRLSLYLKHIWYLNYILNYILNTILKGTPRPRLKIRLTHVKRPFNFKGV